MSINYNRLMLQGKDSQYPNFQQFTIEICSCISGISWDNRSNTKHFGYKRFNIGNSILYNFWRSRKLPWPSQAAWYTEVLLNLTWKLQKFSESPRSSCQLWGSVAVWRALFKGSLASHSEPCIHPESACSWFWGWWLLLCCLLSHVRILSVANSNLDPDRKGKSLLQQQRGVYKGVIDNREKCKLM